MVNFDKALLRQMLKINDAEIEEDRMRQVEEAMKERILLNMRRNRGTPPEDYPVEAAPVKWQMAAEVKEHEETMGLIASIRDHLQQKMYDVVDDLITGGNVLEGKYIEDMPLPDALVSTNPNKTIKIYGLALAGVRYKLASVGTVQRNQVLSYRDIDIEVLSSMLDYLLKNANGIKNQVTNEMRQRSTQ